MNTRGKQIAVAVLLMHALLLAMLGADHWMHRVKRERKPVAVRTFVLEPAPKAAPSTPTKTISSKKSAVPKPPQKKAPVPTAAQDHLLAEIEKNLESFTANPAPVKKTNIAIPTLNTQPQTQPTEPFAVEQIAALLQEYLELPEFGEVKIKLSINPNGRLEKLEILEAKSEKNAEFLKKRLPELPFPCLNELTTLTIVFSNAL
ncbi:MAG TPA: hypothetical protein VHL30_04990 [Chlamydiales bacterium]|jgi:hypothetical protein|nr:hypothetical protein [Chlamydiales bacterium]